MPTSEVASKARKKVRFLDSLTVEDLKRSWCDPLDSIMERAVTEATLTREQYYMMRDNDPNRVYPVVESMDGGTEGS